MRAIDIGGSSRYLCELRVCECHTVSMINVRKERQCHGVCGQCKKRAASVTVSVVNVRKERQCHSVCGQCKERAAVSQCLWSM